MVRDYSLSKVIGGRKFFGIFENMNFAYSRPRKRRTPGTRRFFHGFMFGSTRKGWIKRVGTKGFFSW